MVASHAKSTAKALGKSRGQSPASSPAKTINIGINEPERQKIAEGLGIFLADSFVLYSKTHGFHWNVTGPMFNSLHLMFKDQYTELWAALDVIAERIRALGFPAPYGGAGFAELASIAETAGAPDALNMVSELVEGHESAVRTAQDLYPIVDAANDQPTADLLTQREMYHEKTAWMLRSLLEA
jgi:starvation-inducible DNA-binding protein